MKKIFALAVTILSFNSFAQSTCPEEGSWKLDRDIDPAEIYKKTGPVTNGYYTRDMISGCDKVVWVLQEYGEFSYQNKEEAIKYWQNPENHFAVDKNSPTEYSFLEKDIEKGGYNLAKDTLLFNINGELVAYTEENKKYFLPELTERHVIFQYRFDQRFALIAEGKIKDEALPVLVK